MKNETIQEKNAIFSCNVSITTSFMHTNTTNMCLANRRWLNTINTLDKRNPKEFKVPSTKTLDTIVRKKTGRFTTHP